MYSVIVTNVGTVFEGENKSDALRHFAEAVDMTYGYGRFRMEDVILMGPKGEIRAHEWHFKGSRATRYIRQAATRVVRCHGECVDVDSAFSTVSIGEDIFMQGDEAENFIDEVRALCRRYLSLTENVASLALAEPYLEALE